MNNDRRKEIDQAIKDLEALQKSWNALMDELGPIRERLEEIKEEAASISETLTEIKDAEQESYDNMPESLQGSERGEASQHAVTELEAAIEIVDEFKEWDLPEEYPDLDSAITSADSAKNP